MNDENEMQESVLKHVKDAYFEAPPQLAASVLRKIYENETKKKVWTWRWATLGSGLVTAALAVALYWNTQKTPGLTAFTNQAFMVYLPVKGESQAQLASAEIILPDGVVFYSHVFPELKDQRTIELPLGELQANGYLPFSIVSNEIGKKVVRVRFLDHERNLAFEKEISIQFATKPLS